MTLLKEALAELLGLFVEDFSFAIALIIWIAIAIFVLPKLGLREADQAVIWCAGLIVLLLENVIRSARRRSRQKPTRKHRRWPKS